MDSCTVGALLGGWPLTIVKVSQGWEIPGIPKLNEKNITQGSNAPISWLERKKVNHAFYGGFSSKGCWDFLLNVYHSKILCYPSMITFLLKSCDHKTPCLEDERVKIFMSVISLKLDSFKTKFNAAEIWKWPLLLSSCPWVVREDSMLKLVFCFLPFNLKMYNIWSTIKIKKGRNHRDITVTHCLIMW